MKIRIQFQPRDIWVGVYWKRQIKPRHRRPVIWQTTLYICILPMLPIVITIETAGELKPKPTRTKKKKNEETPSML